MPYNKAQSQISRSVLEKKCFKEFLPYMGRVHPRMGPIHFCEKTINVLLKWTLFLAGPHIQAIQMSCQLCSNVDIKDSWAHQIL